MNPITPKNPKGAGRKKENNVLYQRRMKPELVKKMDEYLTKLKKI